MNILFSIIAVWIVASIPFSLIVARMLANRDARSPRHDMIDLITSTGDVVSIY